MSPTSHIAKNDQPVGGVLRDERVVLDEQVDWPDGTRLLITPLFPADHPDLKTEHVIIAGFGLAGRCVADLLEHAGISYTIIERNPVTVETQRALGRRIIQGDGSDSSVLMRAGLPQATILALTIPEEEAVLAAVETARRLRPDLYIIARTLYASQGMRAVQLGADEVVKAEQAVALQFYDRLARRLRRKLG